VARDEVFVAVDEAGECLGFIWFIPRGAFHSFPYLHVIAVKDGHRGEGIGKELLAFFEETVFADSARAFLVVADFNPDARRLYERLGWRQVGEIPGLYREGVTEYLMMKERGPAAD
jgi:ribosomal protein S18 acetylase RimI-like enzyme